jgi:uncharacterized BrkB/YihY/UPF0761 family membrane protein
MSSDELFGYENPNQPFVFFLKVFAGVLGGLCLGSLIDSLCRTIQKDDLFDWRNRELTKAILYFMIQITINILVLLVISFVFPLRFLQWLQLTISGSFFSSIFFITQQNLVSNALRIFYIHTEGEHE